MDPRLRRRFVALFALLFLGLTSILWDRTGELGYGLSYLALVGISLLSSWALPIAATNAALALLWLALPPGRWVRIRRWVVFLNRQVGHLEALFSWLTLAVVWKPQLSFQLPAAALLFLFGGPLLSAAARALYRRKLSDDGDVN
jgi:hypothetical protein